jgi:valyl-tRNA synthetase
MPFITETLWKRLPGRADDASISVAPWPRPDNRATDAAALVDFALVQQVIGSVRQIRAEYGVQPGQPVRLWVSERLPALVAELGTIERLAKVSAVRFGEAPTEPGAHAVLEGGAAVFVPLGGALDLEKECGRLGAEEAHLRQLIEGQRRKLDNAQFVSRAPAAVVDGERQKLATWTEQADVLAAKRRILGCGA